MLRDGGHVPVLIPFQGGQRGQATSVSNRLEIRPSAESKTESRHKQSAAKANKSLQTRETPVDPNSGALSTRSSRRRHPMMYLEKDDFKISSSQTSEHEPSAEKQLPLASSPSSTGIFSLVAASKILSLAPTSLQTPRDDGRPSSEVDPEKVTSSFFSVQSLG